jgi:hypothetical protein
VADQAHRLEPNQVRLILEGISVREYDSAFCANARNSVCHFFVGHAYAFRVLLPDLTP